MFKALSIAMILMAMSASAFGSAVENIKADCPFKKSLAGQGLVHDSPFIMSGTQTVVDPRVQQAGSSDSGPVTTTH